MVASKLVKERDYCIYPPLIKVERVPVQRLPRNGANDIGYTYESVSWSIGRALPEFVAQTLKLPNQGNRGEFGPYKEP